MILAVVLSHQVSRSLATYIPLCLLAAFIAAMIAMTLTRARGLRNAARVHKWAWLGNDPPGDLPFREIFNEPDRDVQFENVFSGTRKGLEFVAFDCIFGSGRNSTLMSAVAVRSPRNPFGAGPSTDTSVVECGEWWAVRGGKSVFPAHRWMGVAETVAIIESMDPATGG